ncbi:MAG TPA: hypothetical protein VK716_05800 [Terracidiphilus sp.]|jgi:hypothetical protein|nr:hypothetical protein [Terracidiphilus sp.]
MRWILRISFAVVLSTAVTATSPGQVFQLSGGASDLYQAQGGTLTARGPSYDASLSAGVIAGRFVVGANFTKMIGHSTYILGDDYIHFQLPTDIFDSSHYLIALGAGVQANIHHTDIFAFAGATSTDFNSPLFEGVRAENPAGILFLKKQLLDRLAISSKMVFSSQTTAIESIEWQPAEKFTLAASGGVGANQPYGAASLSFLRPWIDAKAAYIEAGSQFHRVAVSAPLMSEPDRENVLVSLKPTHFFTISGGRQNYLTPLNNTQTNVRSTVDQVSSGLLIAGLGLSASLFHSSYLTNSNNASAFTADRSFFSRLHTTASYLESRPSNAPRTSAFITNVSEIISPRLSVTQVINHSAGQTTVSFGGSFLSNIASVSAEYQTYYVPERNASPFEQALIIDVQMHVFRGITVHGASFVAPDGSLRYTADLQAVAARQGGLGVADGTESLARNSIGSNLFRGVVVDAAGQPVSGAALMIDKLLVYTNDEGVFFIRERKPHSHELKVLPDQFLDGGPYEVVSAPTSITSAEEGTTPDTTIVVQRLVRGGH